MRASPVLERVPVAHKEAIVDSSGGRTLFDSFRRFVGAFDRVAVGKDLEREGDPVTGRRDLEVGHVER